MKAYKIFIGLIETVPMVWRRVIVPGDITFKRLHDVIQFSMGWSDSHLYEFFFEKDPLIITNDENRVSEYEGLLGHPEPGWAMRKSPEEIASPPAKLSDKVKIDKYLTKYKIIRYVYDFGDNWLHQIELEEILEDYPNGYPVCIEGEHPCPPEDVGGVQGYKKFHEAFRDTGHPDHEESVEWAKTIRYNDSFDMEGINRFMADILKLKKVR